MMSASTIARLAPPSSRSAAAPRVAAFWPAGAAPAVEVLGADSPLAASAVPVDEPLFCRSLSKVPDFPGPLLPPPLSLQPATQSAAAANTTSLECRIRVLLYMAQT